MTNYARAGRVEGRSRRLSGHASELRKIRTITVIFVLSLLPIANQVVIAPRAASAVATQPGSIPDTFVEAVEIKEGNSGTTEAEFTVRLSDDEAEPQSFGFRTLPSATSSATEGGDYRPAQGTLTFPAGQLVQSFEVVINGDLEVEPDESFLVEITDPTDPDDVLEVIATGLIVNDETGSGPVRPEEPIQPGQPGQPAPAVALTPPTLDFGNQKVGASVTNKVTLTNTGNADLQIGPIDTIGGDFALAGTTCSSPLPSGKDCAINVSFLPVNTGSLTGTLRVLDNAGGSPASPHTVRLTGTGTGEPSSYPNLTSLLKGPECVLAITNRLAGGAPGAKSVLAMVSYVENLIQWEDTLVRWNGADKSALTPQELQVFSSEFDRYSFAMLSDGVAFLVHSVLDLVVPVSKPLTDFLKEIPTIVKHLPKLTQIAQEALLGAQEALKVKDPIQRIIALIDVSDSAKQGITAVVAAALITHFGMDTCFDALSGLFKGKLPSVGGLNATVREPLFSSKTAGAVSEPAGDKSAAAGARLQNSVSVVASGFATNQETIVELWSTRVELGTSIADGQGMISARFALPGNVETGTHIVVASGAGSDGRGRLLIATVEITNEAATSSPLTGASSAKRGSVLWLAVGTVIMVGCAALAVILITWRRRHRKDLEAI